MFSVVLVRVMLHQRRGQRRQEWLADKPCPARTITNPSLGGLHILYNIGTASGEDPANMSTWGLDHLPRIKAQENKFEVAEMRILRMDMRSYDAGQAGQDKK